MAPTSMSERPPSASVVRFTFDATLDPAPPRGWRSDLLPMLRLLGNDQQAEDVMVAAGELIANAVEHGGGVAAFHVEGTPERVCVEVYDRLLSFAGSGRVDPSRGRGLSMVTALGAEWGWAPSDGGKRVWATFGQAVSHAA